METKVCKICGEEKPIDEFACCSGFYRTMCKVCEFFKRNKMEVESGWSKEEYIIIVDFILNKKIDYINDIVPYLQNKKLEQLVSLLKSKLKIGSFKNTQRLLMKCLVCEKEFEETLSRNDAKFCSKECTDKYKSLLGSKKLNCKNCNKEIQRNNSHILKSNNNFCCSECYNEYKMKQSEETRKCKVCGEDFKCLKSSKKEICSRECTKIWQSITYSGENHPSYSQVKTNCDWCNKDISVAVKKYENSNHLFCNINCSREWFSKVYSQTEEFKSLARKNALNNLKNMKYKTDTSIQRIINNLLNSLNINYRNEEIFDFYAVDNFLYDYNLAIEVNGDYFHVNPLFYNEIEYENQLSTIYRDRIKNKFLKNKYNINILSLWQIVNIRFY
jgi:hypothetical protein